MDTPIIRVIVCTKNEFDLIESFLQYYGHLFGFENITVIDNGSDNKVVLDIYEKYKKLGTEVITDDTSFNTVNIFMSKHIKEACKKCDWIVPLETDEFMFWVPSMHDQDSLIDRSNIYKILQNVPNTVSILNYEHFLQSCVKTDDDHYVNYHYSDPVAQMKYFKHQDWKKCILRARRFVRSKMWSHEFTMNKGETVLCSSIGLLHYHNTGVFRLQSRTYELMKGYKYVHPDDSIIIKIAYIHWLLKYHEGIFGGHRLKYFLRCLIRIFAISSFKQLFDRIPTLSEITQVCQISNCDDILVAIMQTGRNTHNKIQVFRHTEEDLLYHEQSMKHEFVITQAINTLQWARNNTNDIPPRRVVKNHDEMTSCLLACDLE
jgi:hypothetical protein